MRLKGVCAARRNLVKPPRAQMSCSCGLADLVAQRPAAGLGPGGGGVQTSAGGGVEDPAERVEVVGQGFPGHRLDEQPGAVLGQCRNGCGWPHLPGRPCRAGQSKDRTPGRSRCRGSPARWRDLEAHPVAEDRRRWRPCVRPRPTGGWASKPVKRLAGEGLVASRSVDAPCPHPTSATSMPACSLPCTPSSAGIQSCRSGWPAYPGRKNRSDAEQTCRRGARPSRRRCPTGTRGPAGLRP